MTGKVLVNSTNESERIILGCRALCGERVTKIAEEANINRQFIYEQKSKDDDVLEAHFNEKEKKVPFLLMNEKLINRLILSSVITAVAVNAKEFNGKILLDTIKVGANNEIFQSGEPVLVGVDPYGTYIFLMEASEKRDGISWCMAIYDKFSNQGLDLDLSVTDGGTGMKKGMREVYLNIKEQGDIFHAEMKLTLGLVILKRKVYSAINEEYENETKLKRASAKKKDKVLANYNNAVKTSIDTILLYDKVNILIRWIKEVFAFGGYSYKNKLNLLSYLIDDINAIPHGNKQLEDGIESLSLNKDKLLLFVKVAQEQIEILAKDENINRRILDLMWKQRLYCETSKSYGMH